MDGIKTVIQFCLELASTKISFGSFSFSFFQIWCCFFAISIVGGFIYSVFDKGE